MPLLASDAERSLYFLEVKMRKGSKMSKESREKMSKAKEEYIPWNKGIHQWKNRLHPMLNKTRIEETRKKISQTLKGRKLSKKHRNNIGKGLKGKKRSEETKRRMSKSAKGKHMGSKHWCWKNGKMIKDGYVWIYQPSHPFCNSKRYIKYSRIVMEKHLCRYLLPEEIVHHINGIKTDDRIKNLQLLSNKAEHMRLHRRKQAKLKARITTTGNM